MLNSRSYLKTLFKNSIISISRIKKKIVDSIVSILKFTTHKNEIYVSSYIYTYKI